MSEAFSPSLISDLENRQDQVLRQLDELNLRVEAAIRDFGAGTALSGLPIAGPTLAQLPSPAASSLAASADCP